MKNYYYFLGLEPTATKEQIKAAYRKLSHKYHPDRNPDDPFFQKRFMQLREAYETLCEPTQKALYDQQLEALSYHQRSMLPPVIKSFSVSKRRVASGEKVIVTWNTLNGDVVKLLPYGLVRGYGEKTIVVDSFENGEFQLLLHVHNTLLKKTVVQSLVLEQVVENLQPNSDAEPMLRGREKVPESKKPGYLLWILLAVAVVVFYYLLFG